MAGVPDCLSGVNNVEGSIPFVAALSLKYPSNPLVAL